MCSARMPQPTLQVSMPPRWPTYFPHDAHHLLWPHPLCCSDLLLPRLRCSYDDGYPLLITFTSRLYQLRLLLHHLRRPLPRFPRWLSPDHEFHLHWRNQLEGSKRQAGCTEWCYKTGIDHLWEAWLVSIDSLLWVWLSVSSILARVLAISLVTTSKK